MDTILIRLLVPVLGKTYDVFVPLDMPISDLTVVAAKGVADLSDGKYNVSGLELLTMRSPEKALAPSLTLRRYAVPEGAELMLL